MSKLSEFLKKREGITIAIMSYSPVDIDITAISDKYCNDHWEVFKRKKDRKRITGLEFENRLYEYLWNLKISELIVILYLEDLHEKHPSIYEANKLLKRTKNQYSATFKVVKRLERLGILYLKTTNESKRKEKHIFINKGTVKIYADDEFRQMLLDEWDTEAKEYIKKKLGALLRDKKAIENKLMMIKRGKRPNGEKNGC